MALFGGATQRLTCTPATARVVCHTNQSPSHALSHSHTHTHTHTLTHSHKNGLLACTFLAVYLGAACNGCGDCTDLLCDGERPPAEVASALLVPERAALMALPRVDEQCVVPGVGAGRECQCLHYLYLCFHRVL